jgi:hypothetical protein
MTKNDFLCNVFVYFFFVIPSLCLMLGEWKMHSEVEISMEEVVAHALKIAYDTVRALNSAHARELVICRWLIAIGNVFSLNVCQPIEGSAVHPSSFFVCRMTDN